MSLHKRSDMVIPPYGLGHERLGSLSLPASGSHHGGQHLLGDPEHVGQGRVLVTGAP